MKLYTYKNAHVTFEKTFPYGNYLVRLTVGDCLEDKILCDDYQSARDYLKSFRKIAKQA